MIIILTAYLSDSIISKALLSVSAPCLHRATYTLLFFFIMKLYNALYNNLWRHVSIMTRYSVGCTEGLLTQVLAAETKQSKTLTVTVII